MSKTLLLVSIIFLAGCSFQDIQDRVSSSWTTVTDPATYSAILKEDGTASVTVETTR